MSSQPLRDTIFVWNLRLSTIVSSALIVLIVVFVAWESGGALRTTDDFQPSKLFNSDTWDPASNQYDLKPMIVGSLLVTLGSALLAVPIGISVAVFLNFYASRTWAWFCRRGVEVIAGVPSVVYGLWGLAVLVPLIIRFSPLKQGKSLLAGIVVLSFMTLPTVIITADAAIRAVPGNISRAAAALGLSRRAIAWSVVVPAARKGLFSAIILQFARAIGETMAVLMVCGNIVQMPGSVFEPAITLTSNIALEMGYADGRHRSILFLSGLVGLGLVVALMLVPNLISLFRKLLADQMKVVTGFGFTLSAAAFVYLLKGPLAGMSTATGLSVVISLFLFRWSIFGRGRGSFVSRNLGTLADRTSGALVWGSVIIVGAAAVVLIYSIFSAGLSQISWAFLTEAPTDSGREGGIAPYLLSTAWIIAVCMATSIPLGLATATYLANYAGKRFGAIARTSLDVLSGVPSIVFGLFGNALFCHLLGMGYSILAGGLTLACMVLPIFIRVAESTIREQTNRHGPGAAALGLSKLTTTLRIVIPSALPGLLAAFTLGLARALSETAALIFTSGIVPRSPESVYDSGRSLSVHIYQMTEVLGGYDRAFATATVLVGLLFLINALAYAGAQYFKSPAR